MHFTRSKHFFIAMAFASVAKASQALVLDRHNDTLDPSCGGPI